MGGVPDATVASGRFAETVELLSSRWLQDGEALSLELVVRIGGAADPGTAAVHLGPVRQGGTTRTATPDGGGTAVRARFPVERRDATLPVRVSLDVMRRPVRIPLRAAGLPMPLARRWGRADPYKAAAHVDAAGHMVVSTERLFPPRPSLGARLRGRLRVRR